MGKLDILATGKGHDEYDLDNPEQLAKAQEALVDMLRGGYLVVAKTPDGKEGKVISFDKETGKLTLADKTQVAVKEAETTAVAPSAGG